MTLHPPPRPPANAAHDAEWLLNIMRELARELRPDADHLEHLGLDHALERDFGLDSLARVELFTRIERDLGTRFDETVFAEAETPRDLLKRISTAAVIETAPPATMADTSPSRLMHPPSAIDTLTGLLDWRAERHGDEIHIILYSEGEGEHSQNISYRQLRDGAQALAAGLLARGLTAGGRVAIMLPTCREFFVAFYGTIYAGCIPVPLYPPARPSQLEDHMRRIAGIVANAGASMLITDERAKILGYLLHAQCAALHEVVTAAELSGHSPATTLPPVHSQDIAFLQYTSGSTGNPKGVILSHANLLANLHAMERASAITADDVFVSWLPLYHDMGLIGACMGSLYVGFRLVLLSPLAFLARPGRWLWTIHQYRATVSAAPNFAYELCASKVDDHELEGLTLDSWRIAYNGAEPVSPDTIENFSAHFARYGYRREAMTPVYGLAENAVGLAFPPPGRGPLIDRVDRTALADEGSARPADAADIRARRIVACGRALPGHDFRIVDAAGGVLPERTQGRVQFRGPSATSGYFQNPEATATLFDGAWLNSGDLGYLAAGELYLTGREKDIIIRAGHNIHPQELEQAISQVQGVRRGGVAVFPATDARSGTERLVVLAEIRDTGNAKERSRIMAEINRLAIDLVGMPADDIVLAPPRTVLKTSSGKVRRAACRELYEHGTLGGAPRAPWLQVLRLALSGARAKALQLLRRAANGVWAAWAWTVFTIVVPLAWLMIVLMPVLKLRRRVARECARLALALTGLTPEVTGLQHLADTSSCIVVANHSSYLDALILTAVLPPRFAFVAKQELLAKSRTSIPLRRLDSAFVERFDSARGVEDVQELEKRARNGDSLIFFPEGTFRAQPGLLPFRIGAFTVAAHSALPVVPVTLNGTRALLRGEAMRPHFARLQVWVHAPLQQPGTDWQAALQLRDAARRQILTQLQEPDLSG